MLKRTGLLAAASVLAITAGALASPAMASAPGSRGDDHRATQQAMDDAVRAGVPGVTARATVNGRGWNGTSGRRGAHDHYRVGSVTKTFVATVMLQLEAEGRLSLDDTVDHWLPGLVTGHDNDGREVTLRQLLNHTSGIFSYTEDPAFQQAVFAKDGFLKNRYRTWTPTELVRIGLGHQPYFKPGAGWHYSNTNYVLAGMVIEKATGSSYAHEIRSRIIAPLHLKATSVPGTRTSVPRPSSPAYAKLTADGSGDPVDVTRINPSVAGASGEVISDSKDLGTFYSALLRGKLLPQRQLDEMKTTVVTDPEDPDAARYGLALMKERLPCGTTVWGHDGGIHGSSSLALSTEDGRHTLAFNFNGDWAGDESKVALAEFCPK
ncbi:beta-lactamase family protein [Streptomyces sp. SID14478]|uniref:serine hydrolase domain-containing protein n=1 Tax=Streptomyces sp. SID14478 TaxID=2706073 RepID=UPI0013E0005B|nr:serine hydrolase domain-containing protein [Streptomyces sp. SID14478]NEB81291.1 beta-lactamase family protein [Streptomyces sp. SID14478]